MEENFTKVAINESFNSEEVITNLIETARTLREVDELQSVAFFEKAMVLSRNAQFNSGVAECLFELAQINSRKGDIGSALSQFHDAAAHFEKSSEGLKAGECYSLLSDICFNIGNYDQALEARLQALNHANKTVNPILSSDYLNKVGDVYKALGDYEKAIENHTLSLKLIESLQDKALLSKTNFYIGNCYNWWGKLDEAYTFLDKSLRIAEELKIPDLQVKPTGSLAILFTKLKEFDRSGEYFFQAIDFVNITGDLRLKADLLKSFGNLFIQKGDFQQAITVLNESMTIAEDLKIKYPKNLIHRFLSDAYEKSGDHVNALLHYKIFTQISEELVNEKVALKTKGIQLKFDLEEIRKGKEQAERAIFHKDQFIANISHEIRTPLNGVLGMANLLSDTNPSLEQQEYINTIKLSANNLITTINDILDYSKIHSGEIRFNSNEFRLREIIVNLIQVIKVKADEKQIKLSSTYDDLIPEVIIGDSVRLNQLLNHLINNAIKFTEKGGINLDIQMVESKGLTAKILFTITDTGVGIAEENIHNIFDSFTQATMDNSRVLGGTGLGLAIVKHLVELQGGSISVNSKLGEGSVFKVELPYKLLNAIETKPGGGQLKSDITVKDLTSVRILLVEDNKVNQFLAQKLLSKMGFTVVIANNGKEAIESLKSGDFNLILMDVQMPEMNGYELTHIIRTTLPQAVSQIPIIALTAYASNQEKEKALSLGMSDYITKPYSPHELLAAILRRVKQPEPEPGKQSNSGKEITASDIRLSSEKLIQLFSGSIEDVVSLLHMLVGQIPQLVNEATQHIQSKNWPATFQSIHKLKSSVNLLKIGILKNSIAELEELSRDQIQTDRIPPVFEEFSKASEQTVSLLKDEIIRLKKSS